MAKGNARAARLKAYLDLVTGGAGAETLAVPGSALESAVPGAAEAAAAAARGLDKLKRPTAPPIAPEEVSAMEAIILPDLRPAIDVVDGTFRATHLLWTKLNADKAIEARLLAAIPAIGRIGLPGQSRIPYAGTGFLVGRGLMMTNRHVASIFASGLGLRDLAFKPGWQADVDLLRERGRSETEMLTVTRVRMIHPWWDMALLEVEGLAATRAPLSLSIAAPEALVGREVAVIGYPAHDPSRNDPDVQQKLFEGVYGVKRLQPGKLAGIRAAESYGKPVEATTHDASTLGGNSGSAVIDLATGEVVGLHFGGRYLDTNYAVPAGALARDGRVVDAGVGFAGSAPGGTPAWAPAWVGLEAAPPAAPAPAAPAPVAPPAPVAAPASVALPPARDFLLRVRVDNGQLTVALADAAALATEALVEPVRDPNYGNRRGYNRRWLKRAVPLPRVADPKRLARTLAGGTLLHYQHFSIAMHAARRLALFTAVNVTRDQALRQPDPAQRTSRRSLSGIGPNDQEKWFLDPRLDARFQIPDAFYTLDRGAFDKGHVVRREDAAWGRTHAELLRANGDTYHVTNCSPQVAGFNRSVLGRDNWGDLEDFLFAHAASARMTLFAGPLLADDDPVFMGTAGGQMALAARVPRAFWKVAVTELADGTGLAAYGFLLSQDLSGVELEFSVPPGLREQMVPLADLEMRTGLVFPALLHAADQFGEALGQELAQATGLERAWLAADPEVEAVARFPGDDEAAPARRPAAAIEEAPRPWRIAESLKKLRAQVNARFPTRSKASDGGIGDAAHASRASDHNPWVVDGANGVVTAIDITHDPASGCDAGQLAQALVASRDPRIKYVIWNRRIANHAAVGNAPAWSWRAYGGSNPHNHHVHISVRPEKARYDSLAPWAV